MNANVTAIEALSSASLGAGIVASPSMNNGAALARLSGASPLSPGGSDALQIQTQPMPQLTFQLLEMLTMLMVGLPNRVSPLEHSADNGARASGEPIQGGKSLYAQGMFHKGAKGAPKSYAFENSPAGIQFAAEHGYSSIDLDMQITKDGVPVGTHWSQPMSKDGFYDPEQKLNPKTKVSEMTLAEVMRLRNKDGQSRIYPMSTMIAELKKHGIAGDLEAKNDPRFATDEIMGNLADLIRKSGVKANLKSIDRGELSEKILKEAQSEGFWVRTAEGGGKARRDIGYGG